MVVGDEEHPHLGGNIAGGDPATFEPQLWAWLINKYGIKTVLDVGCGEGIALCEFQRLGCTAVGIEGLYENISKCIFPVLQWDLEKGPVFFGGIDLVWCCELVEHVKPEYVDNVVDSITVGRILAMTHAVPGQRGHHHVNCQPDDYWIERVASRGMRFLPEESVASRKLASGYWCNSGLLFIRHEIPKQMSLDC
jgi:hypothetical protein